MRRVGDITFVNCKLQRIVIVIKDYIYILYYVISFNIEYHTINFSAFSLLGAF